VQVRGQRWGGQGAEIEGDLLSGGINGDIHISDTRMLGGGGGGGYGHSSVVKTLHAFDKPGIPLDTLAVHDHVPLFAAGSRKQIVHVSDFKGGANGAAGAGGAGSNAAAGAGTTPAHSNGLTGLASVPAALGSSTPGGPLHTGAIVSKFRYQKGFMGTRVGPVTSVAFHPSVQALAHTAKRQRNTSASADLCLTVAFACACSSFVRVFVGFSVTSFCWPSVRSIRSSASSPHCRRHRSEAAASQLCPTSSPLLLCTARSTYTIPSSSRHPADPTARCASLGAVQALAVRSQPGRRSSPFCGHFSHEIPICAFFFGFFLLSIDRTHTRIRSV
jgi:hypothetical protein